ncbi:MAG: hypothetical protein JXQ82_01255 [Methanomicrobiaceae archaeon]|nr:hypothetical protein [Methanomicrobiaceae archaeon]
MADISSSIGENDLFLIFSGANNIKKENTALVSQLAKLNYKTIVVTSNQPYINLIRAYEENNIDTSNIYFVDLISRYALGKEPENKNPKKCRFISTPSNLTDTGIAITEMINLNNSSGETVVVFDSITTMLIYVSSDQISKFIHFLTNKFRLLQVKGIFLVVEGGLDPALEVRFTTFVDKIIR